MPASLTFNQTDVQPDVPEYELGADLDSDCDGETDLRAAVTHYRGSGAEITTSDVLAVT